MVPMIRSWRWEDSRFLRAFGDKDTKVMFANVSRIYCMRSEIRESGVGLYGRSAEAAKLMKQPHKASTIGSGLRVVEAEVRAVAVRTPQYARNGNHSIE